jgi:predicted lipoprotein with Yx(FWY)xxD motif
LLGLVGGARRQFSRRSHAAEIDAEPRFEPARITTREGPAGTTYGRFRMRLTIGLTALVAACLVTFAGPGLAATGSATVKSRHGKLGTYLVDGKGRTLYLFEKDRTKKSTCADACATAWPPLTTKGRPKADGAAKASLLGTSKRADGTTQVTYKGHPLYYFVQDKKAGDTNGQNVNGFGAEWYVISPAGKKIER